MLFGLVPKSFFPIPKALEQEDCVTSLKSVIFEEKALGTTLPPKYISNHFSNQFPNPGWPQTRRNRKQNIHNRGLSVNERKLNEVRLGKRGQKVPLTLETRRKITRNPRVSITRGSSIRLTHTRTLSCTGG